MPKKTIKYEIVAQFKRLKPLPSKRSPSILKKFANEISLLCRRMADVGLASDNYSCIIMQDVYECSDQDTALRYRSRIELNREFPGGHKLGKHGKHGKPGKLKEFEKLSVFSGKFELLWRKSGKLRENDKYVT